MPITGGCNALLKKNSGSTIRLMEEILHHLRCIKPCKYWDKLPINWCRISSINNTSHFTFATFQKSIVTVCKMPSLLSNIKTSWELIIQAPKQQAKQVFFGAPSSLPIGATMVPLMIKVLGRSVRGVRNSAVSKFGLFRLVSTRFRNEEMPTLRSCH